MLKKIDVIAFEKIIRRLRAVIFRNRGKIKKRKNLKGLLFLLTKCLKIEGEKNFVEEFEFLIINNTFGY